MILLLLAIMGTTEVTMYQMKEDNLLPDVLFREIMDQMGNEFVDIADSYQEYQNPPRFLGEYNQVKEIPIELPIDYDRIDTLNPNLSLRDQEYLRHSTLWSHQRMNKEKDTDRHRIQLDGSKNDIKDEKSETNLPAYCVPPNPCPEGYTSENQCLVEFENTAAFSRDYQSAQDCMCDKEHMLDCPPTSEMNGLRDMHITDSDFDQIVEQFQEENPYYRGEKLPIAAKKGINVGF